MSEKKLWWHIATWFGAGEAKIASGTVASLLALPFAAAIHLLFGGFGLLLAAAAAFFIGWWAAAQYLRHCPDKGGDPSEIVIDEVAGQWLILAVLYPTWESYLVGFFLFRVFDVIKPWPVSWADKNIKGGLGVMFDDMLAAMYPIGVYLLLLILAQLTGGGWLHPIVGFLSGGHAG